MNDKAAWKQRYDNYKYAMLFKIRTGRGAVGIRKYYCGWQTFTKLANGNIRYLMELIYKAYEKSLREEERDWNESIDYRTQTVAAHEIGHKNLMELESLENNAPRVTKMLLGLGRIFQLIASSDSSNAPELNQISLGNSESLSGECKAILDTAVMNLALVRFAGNKLAQTQIQDYEYMIHPIFSAYFEISHRRKRKIMLDQTELLGLADKPKEYIKMILNKSFKETLSQIEQPTQMSLFEGYLSD